jgi:hypothetical protein
MRKPWHRVDQLTQRQPRDKVWYKPKSVWGASLEVAGRLLTIAGAICFVVMCLKFRTLALIVLGICVAGLKLQLLGRRYSRARAESVLERDLRDPVVYLRPFNSDSETTNFSEADSLLEMVSFSVLGPFGLTGKLFRLPAMLPRMLLGAPRTEEEQLAYALKRIGPIVAVAQPGETLPPAGFPRLTLHPDNWQQEVTALLRRARLVVVRCGSSRNSEDGYWPTDRSNAVSGGLGWEIASVVNEVPPEKLILVCPFEGVDYETFRTKTTNVFPKGLPPAVESEPRIGTIRSVIWFDEE